MPLDYETRDEYVVIVTATVTSMVAQWGDRATETCKVTVRVTNVNEGPSFDASSYTFYVLESTTRGGTL